MVAHELVIDILGNRSGLKFMMKRPHSEIISIIVKTLSFMQNATCSGSSLHHHFILKTLGFLPNVK